MADIGGAVGAGIAGAAPYVAPAGSGGTGLPNINPDAEQGTVTSCAIGIQSTLPDSDPDRGLFYVLIGSFSTDDSGNVSVANDRSGPIDASICRNWFSWPQTYGVTFIGSP